MKRTEEYRILKFRDKHTIVARVLVVSSVIIFIIAAVLLNLVVNNSLKRQGEMSQLVGLVESQGGDITVARQIYDAVQRVGKLTKLPPDEVPIFATVADIEKLQGQPLFRNAANGDQILYYSKSQWIYIYRQQIDKLVAEGPFVLPSPSPIVQAAPEPQKEILAEPIPPDEAEISPPPSSPVSASEEAQFVAP